MRHKNWEYSKVIPFQERADFDNPDEHAAWVFIALQMSSGDTLNFHPADAESASRQLWEAGFRHHKDLQTHRMSIPGGPDQTFLAAAGGDWVPVSQEPSPLEVARVEVPDISDMSLAQRSALQEQLTALGHGGPYVPPAPEGAEVSEAPVEGPGPVVGEAE